MSDTKVLLCEVNYPVSFTLAVPNDATDDEIHELILQRANHFLETSTVKPEPVTWSEIDAAAHIHNEN